MQLSIVHISLNMQSIHWYTFFKIYIVRLYLSTSNLFLSVFPSIPVIKGINAFLYLYIKSKVILKGYIRYKIIFGTNLILIDLFTYIV